MNKIAILLYLSALLISCYNTKINELHFPAETQRGLNTFGCYIDAKAFIAPSAQAGNVRPMNVYYTPDSADLNKGGFVSIHGIDVRYSLDFAGSIWLQKLQVKGPGEYTLRNGGCTNPNDCDGGGYFNAKEGRSYYIENGTLTITRLDTLNKIVSGRFNFTAIDSSGNRKEIKGGVFDARYIH